MATRSSAKGRSLESGRVPRTLVIVGSTSSGKTSLSLRAAQAFQGEIINADARQIYRETSIGTGKPPGRRGKYLGYNAFLVSVPYQFVAEKLIDQKKSKSIPPEIPHYLMDFLSPDQIMTVAEWRERALKAVRGIERRKHLPIIVGGTGLYVSALVDNFSIPQVPPNPSLRESFEKQPLDKLVDLLLKMDPTSAGVVDLKNARRVIRALEICTFTGKPLAQLRTKKPPVIDPFMVGLHWSRDILNKRIDAAVDRMMEEGWPEEVRRLHAMGLSWSAPAMTSIGYREIAMYLRGELMLEEAVQKAKTATHQYAKRQETWFKRDKRIQWAKNEEEAMEMIGDWVEGRTGGSD